LSSHLSNEVDLGPGGGRSTESANINNLQCTVILRIMYCYCVLCAVTAIIMY
jgi:hypothetical protein